MTKNEAAFIDKISKAAGTLFSDSGILTSVVIAQAILESGWGKSKLAKNANNYFGLNNYNDEVTKIYDNYSIDDAPQDDGTGNVTYHTEVFCRFKNLRECIECLNRWYTMRDYYKCIINDRDYHSVCRKLQGHYATDIHYAEKLINIIDKYALVNFDVATSDKIFYVQSGAFTVLNNAQRAAESIKQAGYACVIKYDHFDAMYRIQTGAFTSHDNALRYAKELCAKGIGSFVSDTPLGVEEV